MLTRNMLTFVGLTFLLGALTGCGSWNDATDFSDAVWSDDDTKVAFVKRYFKKKKNLTHSVRKDFSVEVFVADADGLNASQLTGKRMGSVKDLFYMNEAGYIILGRGLEPSENAGTQTQTIIYEKIDLDGSTEQIAKTTGNIMVSCDGGSSSSGTTPPLRVIPSRDGNILALVESTSDCNGHSMTIGFLDAFSLNPIGSKLPVDTELLGVGFGPGGLGLGFLTMSWTPEGTFIVSKGFGGVNGLSIGWEFAVGATEGVWVDSIGIDCMHVATSSGSTATDGTEVFVEDDGSFSFGINNMFAGCY